MDDRWQEFLRQQGATHTAGAVRDFGDAARERRAAREADAVMDLSHFSLVHASGPDVTDFLNGQLTNDVAELAPGTSQLAAWCSPKGRMLALFRVLRHGEGYLLQLPAALRDEVSKRLRMYVLRSKVVLASADDRFVRLGIVGPRAPAFVAATAGTAPEGENDVAVADDVIVLRLPGPRPRYELLVPPDRAPAVWTTLARDAAPVGSEAWTWHDVMAGIPAVLPQTSDTFIPQTANLDLLGGVSFSKGCYTGQEIVARLHYRGRLKQRMYRARTDTGRVPEPGEPIYAAGTSSQSAGNVVIAAAGMTDGCDLLAVLYIDKAQAQLRLGGVDGPPLTIEALPYAVPAE